MAHSNRLIAVSSVARGLLTALALVGMAEVASAGTVDTFKISLDQVVSNGNPAPGAGNIETPGAVDVYTFNADPGTEVFFNEVVTNNCTLVWTLTDPKAQVVFSETFGQCGPDVGVLTLEGGRYTLTVQIPAANATAAYSFVLVTDASVQEFAIELNEVVSDGHPAPGAGKLEYPGAVDTYVFDLDAETEVTFNEVITNNCSIWWTVTDDADGVVFSQTLGQCGPDAGTFLLAPGTYHIRVEDPSGNAGPVSYSFVLVTPDGAQQFEIGLDQVVSNGNPAPGAGNIEEPGAVDIYTFEARPGVEVFFNEVFTTNCGIGWTVTDENDVVVFSQPFGQCGPDAGTFTLAGGTYTIRVEELSGNGVGTYAFSLITSASEQHFEIELDSVVSDGVPAAGAGRIEYAGASDVYTFTAPPGTSVFFNEVLTNDCGLAWKVTDEKGEVLVDQPMGQCGPDTGTLVLEGGTYTIRVSFPSGNAVTPYIFSLVSPASTESFDIGYGEIVSNGVPGPGAGNIGFYGAVDLYMFEAEAGDKIIFSEIITTNCNLIWTVTSESQQVLFSEQMGQCGPDAGAYTLTEGGTYTVRLEDPTGNSAPTYSFGICSAYSPDIDCDGHVNAGDLAILLGAWGSAGPAGDLDKNGIVEAADLAILLGAWTG